MMSEISYTLFVRSFSQALETLTPVYNMLVREIICRLIIEVLYKGMLLVVGLSSQMGVSPYKLDCK